MEDIHQSASAGCRMCMMLATKSRQSSAAKIIAEVYIDEFWDQIRCAKIWHWMSYDPDVLPQLRLIPENCEATALDSLRIQLIIL